MQNIKFHYAQPDEILALNDQDFQDLLHSKIYKINPRFIQNQPCMNRLVKHIKKMQATTKNIKLAEQLIRTFQIPILFFLHDFYINSDAKFSTFIIKQKNDTNKISKKKEKCLKILQQISQLYKNLTDGLGKIEYFQFFTKYGTQEKQIMFQRIQPQYQIKYIKFIKKLFQYQPVMKDPNMPFKGKYQLLKKFQQEFESIIKETEYFYFQEQTFKTIYHKYQSLITSSKNHDTSLNKNGELNALSHQNSSINLYKNQKKKTGPLNSKELEELKAIIPCCRTYFFENQQISKPQSFTLQYKNYRYPYDKFCQTNLRKTICAFLNRGGGVILVGIEQKQDKTKRVKGQYLSENDKQQVLKEYKYICQDILPDIISQSKYVIKFVPIKDVNNEYLPGKYIVRVQIQTGNLKSLYTFKQDKFQYVAFRTANQVLKRGINQDTLTKYKQRLLNPKVFSRKHNGDCPQPQIGQLLWQDYSECYRQPTTNKRRLNTDGRYQSCHKKDNRQKSQNNKIKYRQKMQEQNSKQKNKKNKIKQNFVYFNLNDKQQNQNGEINNNKSQVKLDKQKITKRRKNQFLCDNDQDQNQSEKDSSCQNEQNTKQVKQDSNNQFLNFQPLNPVSITKKPQKFIKKLSQSTNILDLNANSINILDCLQNTQSKYQSFKVQQKLSVLQSHQKPISQTRCLDMLIVGFPYDHIKQLIKLYQIALTQQPIKCNNDHLIWLKVSLNHAPNHQQFSLFKQGLTRKHTQLNISKQLKIRKLYNNIIFQDQMLLNKLIHKLRHNQQFTDRRGCIYYSCRSNMESIQAFLIAYQMNIKVKFISDMDLKTAKLQQFKYRAQFKQSPSLS